jgi:hypothetical protein
MEGLENGGNGIETNKIADAEASEKEIEADESSADALLSAERKRSTEAISE